MRYRPPLPPRFSALHSTVPLIERYKVASISRSPETVAKVREAWRVQRLRVHRAPPARTALVRRDITRSPRPVALARSPACERDGSSPTEASGAVSEKSQLSLFDADRSPAGGLMNETRSARRCTTPGDGPPREIAQNAQRPRDVHTQQLSAANSLRRKCSTMLFCSRLHGTVDT
ncbi:unnamed protein product, partial [Iphiclides podalirius]